MSEQDQKNYNDQELFSVKFDTQQKTFFVDLKDSPRGRYLKISEKRFGKKTTIIVPEEGVERLRKGIEAVEEKLIHLHSSPPE